jgi:hypothetical protein
MTQNFFLVKTMIKYHSKEYSYEFCHGVYNQYESFIYLVLMVKNMELSINRYFKW